MSSRTPTGARPALPADELARLLGLPAPTPEQIAVIESPLQPALVVAGAGSGKTETMAARVVFLVANGLVRPDQILGLTFTRKAAAQLAQRVRRRLRALAVSGVAVGATGVGGHHAIGHEIGRALERGAPVLPNGPGTDGGEPAVSTYHAFGGRLIAEYGALAGVEAGSTVLTPTAAWQLARRVVARWDGDLDADLSPDAVTERLLAMSGALADHLIGPSDLEAELDRVLLRLQTAPPSARQRSPLHSGLAKHVKTLQDRRWILPLVRAFRAAKQERGVIDFADQMQVAAELVDRFAGIGESLRDRYRVVLLDEYQDTGHAQRALLRTAFGAGPLPTERAWAEEGPPGPSAAATGHPVTAVGDPVQSIYSWRGASASNLPAFGRDFPTVSGAPAPTFSLLTSFRNPVSVLQIANLASAPIRSQPGTAVGELRPGPEAGEGIVRHALFGSIGDEDEWVADRIAELWRAAGALSEDPQAAPTGVDPPTTAVLLRRRADMAAMAVALRQRGLPVEVVGLGGLIDEPEVADLIAVLRVLVDPTAGSAALRILTGARWRIGPADLAALHRRAGELAGRIERERGGAAAVAAVRSALAEVSDGEDIDAASLVDALADLGPPEAYSPEGYRRLARCGAELDRLRGRLQQPLADVVSDIERTIGLEIEVQLTGGAGRAHLDAFAQVVADVAATGAGPTELLDYVDAAAEREDGLAPGEVPAAGGQVQVLTVHAAKGLEWEIVAVPHLTDGVFPSSRGGTWLGDPSQLPPSVRGDRADLPDLHLPSDADQKDLADRLAAHVEAFREFRLTEERRLLYVALTRAERVLLVSGHHWGATTSRPSGPSAFLDELAPVAGQFGVPDRWDPAPAESDGTPVAPRTALWPQDPLSDRRAAVADGAARVLAAIAAQRADTGETRDIADHRDEGITVDPAGRFTAPAGLPSDGGATGEDSDQDTGGDDARSAGATGPAGRPDPYGWRRDLEVLLVEREERARPRIEVPLPTDLSVSALVDLADDPAAVALRLRRPMPTAPSTRARRGQAFHAWLESFYRGEALIGTDQLPGAEDGPIGDDPELGRLQRAFRASTWAGRLPTEIEVPFATRIAGIGVRGRVDAVFSDPDGGITVVDWKTGDPPAPEHRAAGDVQLACYRLALHELTGIPLDRVRAVFHYVRTDRTVAPTRLLDADGIASLLEAAVGDGAKDSDPTDPSLPPRPPGAGTTADGESHDTSDGGSARREPSRWTA